LVMAEKIWFKLRGDVVPVSLLNSSQSALRFHAVVFENESVNKLKTLLSEALAVEKSVLELHLMRNNNAPQQKSTKLQDGIKIKKLVDHSPDSPNTIDSMPFSLQLRFRMDPECESYFKSEHFIEECSNNELKSDVVNVLRDMFFTHATCPLLQEANKVLICLGAEKSKTSPLKRFASSPLFDRNLLGMIFKYADQKPQMNIGQLTQHILSCGISPSSTSASRDRVSCLMRKYGSLQSSGEFEMDFNAFVRFYTDAFVERPMLSWYDYLSYGFSHDFQRDFRISPLCVNLQKCTNSSRYQFYRLQDYLNPESFHQSPQLNAFWATNRVEFTARGVLDRPNILKLLENVSSCSELRDISSSVCQVLEFRKSNSDQYSVSPIAALYL
jgi:hypothetical protein